MDLKRIFASYVIQDISYIKLQVLAYGNRFNTFSFLDSHEYDFRKSYECIAGAGTINSFLSANGNPGLSGIDAFRSSNNDWIFGHLSYDVKNEIEALASAHPDGIEFPEMFFFIPKIVFIISESQLHIGTCRNMDPDKIFKEITSIEPAQAAPMQTIQLRKKFKKKEFLSSIIKLQKHIAKGDCYEINFCQEFFSKGVALHPLHVYQKLSENSPNPFSAFYKLKDKFLMCASPERFLKKKGDLLLSQPIKGTAKRITENCEADTLQKELLRSNKKERSENIMIVDLVRNDLSKVCIEGSVKVEDFLGVYSFPQVHQMISTVSGRLNEATKISEIIHATFPMGSMTGAPKKKVMELIEHYEKTKRGLFSGTIGYITPEGDFDFNVVIRSVQYNQASKYISVMAGSAITHHSVPEKEYEECILKVSAMKQALS